MFQFQHISFTVLQSHGYNEVQATMVVSVPYHFLFMKITGSSAIANVDFSDNNRVSVQFTTNDTPYEFLAKDASLVRSGLESAINKGDSVGRLIASYRASGELTAV